MGKLSKKFKKQWVNALLSGEYEQVFGTPGSDRTKAHCVLGVGGVVKYGTCRKAYKVLNGDDAEGALLTLNDEERVPFDILAGVIDEWL